MSKFKKGDIVELVDSRDMSAMNGARAIIVDIDYDYIYVKWIRKTKSEKNLAAKQSDGSYIPSRFILENSNKVGFQTKDSGKRQEFSTGMVRDTQEDKARYDLVYLPLLKRWAELMARGATKYGERNWEKAETEEEFNRFKSSAFRHFMQYLDGEDDEDHAAAVLFNIGGMEMVKSKLKK